MSDYQTPCSDPANDPNDWFISRDGVQYPHDPMPGYGTDEVMKAWGEEEERLGRALTDEEERKVDDRVFEQAKKVQLQSRRHAKDKCFSECYVRTRCLETALQVDTPATHGTWGGYFEEELRELRREIGRRRRAGRI